MVRSGVVAAMFLWVGVGCVAHDAVGTPDAPGPGLTTAEVCADACAAEIECGLTVDSSVCMASCEAGTATYLVCVRAAMDDCGVLANCFFAAQCGAAPNGAQSCGTTAECEGVCNVSDPTNACACACIDAMAPSKSLNLLINNLCALSMCPASCTPGTSFDGITCNDCFTTACTAQNQQCLDN